MHLEVFKGDSGYFFVRLVGGNQETIMVSEAYDSHFNAKRSAQTVSGVTALHIIYVDDEEPGP